MADSQGAAGGSGGGNAGGGGASAGAAGSGAQAPWYEPLGLDEPVKNYVVGKAFGDVKSALVSGMNADKLLRERNVLPAPVEGKYDDWEGHEKLGWIKDRAGYKIEAQKVPDGISYSKQMEEKFVDLMHANRVPAPKGKALLDGMIGLMLGELEGVGKRGLAQLEEVKSTLGREWGSQYEGNLSRAQAAARLVGFKLDDLAHMNSLMGNADMLRGFDRLGRMLGEDTLKGGAGAGGSGGGRPGGADAARAEQTRLRGDESFMARMRRGDPGAKKQWQDLSERVAKG